MEACGGVSMFCFMVPLLLSTLEWSGIVSPRLVDIGVADVVIGDVVGIKSVSDATLRMTVESVAWTRIASATVGRRVRMGTGTSRGSSREKSEFCRCLLRLTAS